MLVCTVTDCSVSMGEVKWPGLVVGYGIVLKAAVKSMGTR